MTAIPTIPASVVAGSAVAAVSTLAPRASWAFLRRPNMARLASSQVPDFGQEGEVQRAENDPMTSQTYRKLEAHLTDGVTELLLHRYVGMPLFGQAQT